MDSLEHMLAELETPSNDHRNTLDDIGNIDDFLDKIEEEARMSHNTRLNTDFQVDPYYSNSPPKSQPVKQQQAPVSQPQKNILLRILHPSMLIRQLLMLNRSPINNLLPSNIISNSISSTTILDLLTKLLKNYNPKDMRNIVTRENGSIIMGEKLRISGLKVLLVQE
jgi:hypothetical protein